MESKILNPTIDSLKKEFESLPIFINNGIVLWERLSGEYANKETRQKWKEFLKQKSIENERSK